MNDGDNVNDDDDRDDIISLLACCKINSVRAFTFTFQYYLKLWKQLLLSLVTISNYKGGLKRALPAIFDARYNTAL